MNNFELEAYRRLLFFSIVDAAKFIGNVSPRAWRKWEHGEAPVPDDVRDAVLDLIAWREDAIASMIELLGKHKADAVEIRWYQTKDEWLVAGHDAIHFMPQKSAIAHILSQYSQCRLIAV